MFSNVHIVKKARYFCVANVDQIRLIRNISPCVRVLGEFFWNLCSMFCAMFLKCKVSFAVGDFLFTP